MTAKKKTAEEEFDSAPDAEAEFEAADPLLPQEAVAPEVMKGRRDRLIEAVKSLPSQAKRLAGKAMDFQYRAVTHPVDTAKDLTDFGPEGLGGALVRGVGQGASAGFVDELDGLNAATQEFRRPIMSKSQRDAEGLPEQPQSYMDAYLRGRDQRRHDDDVSEAASPDAFGYAKTLSAAAAPVKPGLANAALYGGAYGLGASRADLTKGEFQSAGDDMVEGGSAGFATAAALKPLEAAGKYGRALQARGTAAEEAGVQHAATKDFAREAGGLGSDSGVVGRRLDYADHVIANPQRYPPELVAEASGFVNSELGRATRERAARNAIRDLPRSMAQMTEREAAMNAAAAAAEPEAVAATARDNLSKSWLKQEVLPRADRLVGNKALSMLGEFGGAPVTTTKNLLKAPLTQVRAGQAMQTLAAPGAAAQKLQPAATQTLSDYLRPMSDKERDEQGTDWFLSQ